MSNDKPNGATGGAPVRSSALLGFAPIVSIPRVERDISGALARLRRLNGFFAEGLPLGDAITAVIQLGVTAVSKVQRKLPEHLKHAVAGAVVTGVWNWQARRSIRVVGMVLAITAEPNP